MAVPPVDIVIRVWTDRDPEVISPLADWMTAAALNRVLDSYVEYEVKPAPEEEEE